MAATKHPPSTRRRWTTKPWPWPGDSREDKAKRVASSYRELVCDIIEQREANPIGALYDLDAHWAVHGVFWPVPGIDAVDADEWLTAVDLAHYIDRTPADIYRWARRGKIQQRTGPDGSPEYLLASAIEYQRRQRERRRG